MLFAAKWNVPQAAEELGMLATEESWEQVKVAFAEYCKHHKATWTLSD
jgi:hypothetical protein